MRARLCLPLGSTFEKIDHIGLLCAVPEIVSNCRLKHLSYEIAHTPEPRNYLRRIFPRDMNDLRDIEVERKSIRGLHFYCESFSSSLWDSVLPVAQFRTMFVVGTISTLWVKVF